jgi:hypothetical protein
MLYGFCNGCKNGAMKKLLLVFGMIIGALFGSMKCSAWTPYTTNNEIYCKDVEFIFARGSGGELGETSEFLQLMPASSEVSQRYGISVLIRDLDYPAVGLNTPVQIIQTFVSAGKAYSFGNSVKLGVNNLRLYYRAAHKKCPDMKFGFIGYSQGAMVISSAAKYFDTDSTLFLMLLGDPETYLPEGEGLFPSACSTGKKSSWRAYAPNCRTAAGVFGARKPYEASHLKGKYSLWCNRKDYICGSSRNPLSNSGHTLYSNNNEIGYGIDYLMRKAGYQEVSLRSRAMASDMILPEYFNDEVLGEMVDDGASANLPAPQNVNVSCEASSLHLNWSPIDGAKYLLIRFNGVDLGYVDAALGEFEIRDVNFDEEYRLELAWMDEDANVGEIVGAEEVKQADVARPVLPVSSRDGSLGSNNFSATLPDATIKIQPSSLPRNEEIVARQPQKANGLSFTNKADIVNIVIALFGASGLLLTIFLRKRRQ